jgi:hypothetical protein
MEKRFTRVKTASNVSMSMSVHDMELCNSYIQCSIIFHCLK